MIPKNNTPIHWHYFIALENDISQFSRFLEIAESNFSSYSIELGRILFAAASEVDVVAKKYCQKLENGCVADNIGNYKTIITKHHTEFNAIKVHLPRFGLTLTPWNKWRTDTQPLWWRAYTKVKYERHEHFAEANLKNALNAVAALYVLQIFLYRREAEAGELYPYPQLFLIGETPTLDAPTGNHAKGLTYNFVSADAEN